MRIHATLVRPFEDRGKPCLAAISLGGPSCSLSMSSSEPTVRRAGPGMHGRTGAALDTDQLAVPSASSAFW